MHSSDRPFSRLGPFARVVATSLVLPALAGCEFDSSAYIELIPVVHQGNLHLVLSKQEMSSEQEHFIIYRIPRDQAVRWPETLQSKGAVRHAASYGKKLLVFHDESISAYRIESGRPQRFLVPAPLRPGSHSPWTVRTSAVDERGRLVVFGIHGGKLLAAGWNPQAAEDESQSQWTTIPSDVAVKKTHRPLRIRAIFWNGAIYVGILEKPDGKDQSAYVNLFRLSDGEWAPAGTTSGKFKDFDLIPMSSAPNAALLLVEMGDLAAGPEAGFLRDRSQMQYRIAHPTPSVTGPAPAEIVWSEPAKIPTGQRRSFVQFLRMALVSVESAAGAAGEIVLFRIGPKMFEAYRFDGTTWAPEHVPDEVNSYDVELAMLAGLSLSLFLIVFGASLYRVRRRRLEGPNPELDRIASLARRLLAHGVDILLLFPIWYLLIQFLGVAEPDGRINMDGVRTFVIAAQMVLVVYGTYCEGRWSATPGKWLMQIRVELDDGAPCSTRAAFTRNVFRFFDENIPIGLLFMAFTRRSQRIGDLVARTVVVRADAAQPARESLARLRTDGPPGRAGIKPDSNVTDAEPGDDGDAP